MVSQGAITLEGLYTYGSIYTSQLPATLVIMFGPECQLEVSKIPNSVEVERAKSFFMLQTCSLSYRNC